MSKSFGSGYFGEWIKGEYGLPAYNYTCNQLIDDKAITQTNTKWMGQRDHTFMFGNDRIVATCSNYGYCQIRQDEGTPKFLTDYDPKNNQFGGGFGYLVSDGNFVSTYYNGQDMLREYGAGYFKKIVKSNLGTIEQLLFAPYGDDPLVINRVKITNTTDEARNYKWYEYWAGEMYQFTFTQFIAAGITTRLRRSFARSFTKMYQLKDNYAIARKLSYSKSSLAVRGINKIVQGLFRKKGRRFYDTSKAYSMDFCPPDVILADMSGEDVNLLTNADAFFGSGGVLNPDYLNGVKSIKNKNSMLMLEKSFSLKAGESKTLHFGYMYIPEGYDASALLEKYRNKDIDDLFKDTCNSWLNDRVKVNIKGYEWIDRELCWHNAYLRGAMTYSSYYKAHILSQGGHYQYILGLQGAPRDQLQHSLPFIFSEPYIAREHILFTLREQSPQGELPYATTGEGMLFCFVMVPSDLQFMLMSFAAEYILTTRDYNFLDYKYSVTIDGKEVERTVKDGLRLAYNYATKEVGKGPHGLIRMKTGDWNDQAVYGRVPISQIKTVHKIGESMLNSAIATYSFDALGKMLLLAGEDTWGEDSLRWASEIREAVREQWNGKWFKRAWMGDKVGWLGDDLLWLEPQPWTIIGGAADKEQGRILADNINELLSKPNPNGAQLINHNEEKQEKSAGLDVGVLENGGIWPAVNGYLVWALSKVNPELAFSEWLKNSRAYQAEAYPDIWYGIWSGPDSINAANAVYPGRTQNSKNPITGKREKFFKLTVGVDWEDYPVLNLHAHTWQQYTIFKLLGLEFNHKGFVVQPVIPSEEYSVESRIFSLIKDKNSYKCKYTPLQESKLVIEFGLNGETPKELIINGEREKIIINANNRVEFTAQGKEISFEIKLK